MTLVFSSKFESDFSDTIQYLAQEASVEVADRWAQQVERTLRLLLKHPELGRVRRDLKPEGICSCRLADFDKYLVFYKIAGHELQVLRVRHGAMNLQALFPE